MSKKESLSPLFSNLDTLPKPALDLAAACIVVERFLIANPHHINSTVGVLVAEIAFSECADSRESRTPRDTLVAATPFILSSNVIGAARRHVCHNSDALLAAHPSLVMGYRGRHSTKPPRQAWKASARRARNAADRCNALKAKHNIKHAPDVDFCALEGNKWATLPADEISKMF